MEVSIWAVLGIVLLILGLPFVFLYYLTGPTSPPGFAFMTGIAVGAGAAFLLVAAAQWIVGRDHTRPMDQQDLDLS